MVQPGAIKVRKANGELVDFEPQKLITALMRSGASRQEAERVARQVIDSISQGTKTSKIYKLAYQLVKKKSAAVAGRYRLKKAVYDLGPSGYPFEKFMARLMESQGYQVITNRVEQGKCVSHELDVVAENNREKIMIECKFHRDKGHKNDVKIPLYIQSRFMDIKAAWEQSSGTKDYVGMIATNTRFSEDAISYAQCVGLRLISWDYPSGYSLRELIDRSGFHPVTTLHSLSKTVKNQILDEGIVLCRDLLKTPEILDKLGVMPRVKKEALAEAAFITEHQHDDSML